MHPLHAGQNFRDVIPWKIQAPGIESFLYSNYGHEESNKKFNVWSCRVA
jgi:hypothetical protein